MLLYLICRLVSLRNSDVPMHRCIDNEAGEHVGQQLNRSLDNCIWRHELEMAVLDYPLKYFYPEIHELVLMTLDINHAPMAKSSVQTLLNAHISIKAAVKLLKGMESEHGEQLLDNGLKAFDVFAVIRSEDLITKLFTEIVK